MKDERVDDLRVRTKRFALDVIEAYSGLPKKTEAQVIGRQLLRSGTSVGAHYREATRGKSDADFISKVEGCLQELEETAYWLDLLVEGGIVGGERFKRLSDETEQLTAIFVTIVRKVKRRIRK